MCVSVRYTCAVFLLLLSTTGSRADLLVYYDFNEASGKVARDLSGNNNDGKLSKPAGYAQGVNGTALNLGRPDNGAFVTISSAARGAFDTIVDTQSATIAFWMNRQGLPASRSAAAFCFDGGDSGLSAVSGRQLSTNLPWIDGDLYFDTGGCCGSTQRLRTPMPANVSSRWVHFAFVRDKTTTIMYLNGKQLAASPPGAIQSPVSPIVRAAIGANNENVTHDYYGSHSGLIDDFAVWDRALGPAEIARIASGGSIMPAEVETVPVVRTVETPQRYDRLLNRMLLGISITLAVLLVALVLKRKR